MIIKVCGMQLGDNIQQVEALGVNMIGLIFASQSPRYVNYVPDYLPNVAKRVGVFVDAPMPLMRSISSSYRLDYLQLHGDESPQMCVQLRELGQGVIKAISVSNVEDVEKANQYDGACDYILFDTKTPTIKGGSGVKFDWSILDSYQLNIPFLLSGGISVDDAKQLQCFKHTQFAGLDLNSRFEISPGLKDIELIKTFLQNINCNE